MRTYFNARTVLAVSVVLKGMLILAFMIGGSLPAQAGWSCDWSWTSKDDNYCGSGLAYTHCQGSCPGYEFAAFERWTGTHCSCWCCNDV